MIQLEGENILLRSLLPKDIDILLEIENDERYWHLSGVTEPYSKEVLEDFIKHAHQDIHAVGQYRFVIEDKTSHQAVGLIDLFELDIAEFRAGVGIMMREDYKRLGYALEALSVLADYAKERLQLDELFATIPEDNEPSISLFKKAEFEEAGKEDSILHFEKALS